MFGGSGGGYTPCGGGYTIHLSYREVGGGGGGYTPCGVGYTTPKILLSSPVTIGHWD